MRKCPNCDKTFDDSMRFCQTDGTPLLDFVEEVADDPLKTTVVRQEDFASAIPAEDPFKSSGTSSVPKEDSGDLLQLPEEYDPMKTMVAPNQSNFDLNFSEPQPPVSQFEEKVEEVSALAPEPPRFSEPSLSPPNFGDMSPSSSLPVAETPKIDDEPPPTAIYMPESSPFSTPASTPQSPVSPFDNVSNNSPFDRPMEKPSTAPIPSPFDTPPPVIPTFQEPHPIQPSSPFEQPLGFGGMQQQNQGFNQPVQNSDWTPPPAPNASWQDQGLGANTPFQPPPAGVGQDQTLAIVSLVCGILGICLCGIFTAIPAIITGFMAKNNADANPAQYGGRGMALAGIILGAVSIVLTILYVIFVIASGGRGF